MRMIIAGTRTLVVSSIFLYEVFKTFSLCPTEIVSGHSGEVDLAGERYAQLLNLPIETFPAKWASHGKAAGPIRNKEMADYADVLVLIWDGESRGSLNMKTQMQNLKKPIYEVVIKKV